MNIFLAIILGLLFGFVLQKVGAANPQELINMLRLKDLHLMKAIFFAIGISSLVLFILLAVGMIDTSHISIKSSYVGVIIGGAILGLGWAISGFCPGTGVVALGVGRKDAISFVLGGLLGALVFTLGYGAVKSSFLFAKLGDKITLAETGNEKFPALLPGLPGIVVAGVIAVVFIIIAWMLPDKNEQ
ncbi:hypothetical protein CSA56_07805 [candidate division KSB3 bacterium]|uniref:Uncharacterized protein n=1 Tax=candidate division KSB3 bacterium TaxID=2044937 RepID=A0A2G6KH00_9BACT|nr:MAG: hypothetical protein CSA56_07805 [candidate division KSB3 bacterium]